MNRVHCDFTSRPLILTHVLSNKLYRYRYKTLFCPFDSCEKLVEFPLTVLELWSSGLTAAGSV